MNDEEIKRWISVQRSFYKRGVLQEWKVKALNQFNFSWSRLDNNNLAMKYPLLLKEWDYDKNVNIDPNNVSFGSYKKVWWKCEKNHSWRSKVSHRTSGSACPYCYGTKACKDNCLQTINPDISKYWHSTKNGKITPSDVTLGSGNQVWWKCRNCKKPYKTTVKNRVKSRFGFCGKCRIDKKVKN